MEKRCPFNFLCVSCLGHRKRRRWQWKEGNEELHWDALQRWTSLPALQDLTHICWHPQIFQGLAKPWVLPPLITCCSLCCFGGFCHLHTFYLLCILKPQVQGESRAQGVVLGQEHKSRIFTSWNKLLIKSHISAAISAGRVLPCLMPSEKQQGFTSDKRLLINLEVRWMSQRNVTDCSTRKRIGN